MNSFAIAKASRDFLHVEHEDVEVVAPAFVDAFARPFLMQALAHLAMQNGSAINNNSLTYLVCVTRFTKRVFGCCKDRIVETWQQEVEEAEPELLHKFSGPSSRGRERKKESEMDGYLLFSYHLGSVVIS